MSTELHDEFLRLWMQLAEMLLEVMSNAPVAITARFAPRVADLRRRSDEALKTYRSLPESDRLQWGIAHLEGLNEEMRLLVKEIKAALGQE